jgi:hypothetical protein
MENKKLKPAFALLVTIVFVTAFLLYSYAIIENNLFQRNLNTLKYTKLQGEIHMDYVKEYIGDHNDTQISSLTLGDDRFDLHITIQDEDALSEYYIVIEAKDAIPVRLSEKIIK